ncbi:MAG: hypothetical protein OEU92_07015 [Alphaproteobacteria bacterium]|nr:hypothetical protein [Alphaproteobacteria bacterium]
MPEFASDPSPLEDGQGYPIHPRYVPIRDALAEFREAARRDKSWVADEDPASERMCALEADEESSFRIMLQCPVILTMIHRSGYRDPGMRQLCADVWYSVATCAAFTEGVFVERDGTRHAIFMERDVLDHLLSQIDFIRKSNAGRPRRIISYDWRKRPLLKFLDQMTEAEKRAADEIERQRGAQRIFDQPLADSIDVLEAGPALTEIGMPEPGAGDGDPVEPVQIAEEPKLATDRKERTQSAEDKLGEWFTRLVTANLKAPKLTKGELRMIAVGDVSGADMDWLGNDCPIGGVTMRGAQRIWEKGVRLPGAECWMNPGPKAGRRIQGTCG